MANLFLLETWARSALSTCAVLPIGDILCCNEDPCYLCCGLELVAASIVEFSATSVSASRDDPAAVWYLLVVLSASLKRLWCFFFEVPEAGEF